MTLFRSSRLDAGCERASGVMDPMCASSIRESVVGSFGLIQRMRDVVSIALLRRWTIRCLEINQRFKVRARGDILISGRGRLKAIWDSPASKVYLNLARHPILSTAYDESLEDLFFGGRM